MMVWMLKELLTGVDIKMKSPGPETKTKSENIHQKSSWHNGDCYACYSPRMFVLVGENVANNPFLLIPGGVCFVQRGCVEVVLRVGAIQPIQRDAAADLLSVQMSRHSLVLISKPPRRIITLRRRSRVEVIIGPMAVQTEEWNGVFDGVGEDAALVPFLPEMELSHGVGHLRRVRGVEVIRGLVCALEEDRL